MAEYIIYFDGKIEAEGETESEATEAAYRALDRSGAEFNITGSEKV